MRMGPTLRLIGFSDDWRESTLADYLVVSKLKNKEEIYGKDDVLSVSGDYGIVNQIAFQGKSLAGKSVANYGVVETGDVVYTKSPLKTNPYGIIKTNRGQAGIVSTLYAVYKPKENVTPEFVQVYFENDTRMNNYVRPLVNKGAKNDMKVSAEDALKGKVVFPSIAEQVAIVAHFDLLDDLISSSQHELDVMGKAREYYLRNMFPATGMLAPKLRLEGFTDEWDVVRLGNIVDRVTRKNTFLESELPLTISAQYGLIDQNEFFERRIASKDVSGYYLLKKGEFAYNKSTSGDAEWGAVKRLDRYDMGVLSTLYIAFRIRDESVVYSDFIATYYETKLWHRDIRGIAAEGARNHGLLNIAPADFFDTKVVIPKSFDEQKSIGQFFANFNSLIDEQRKKVMVLKSLKEFMLQNMFV